MLETSVAVVGGGPAGIAAAIQLQRSDVTFSLFEKTAIGGLLRNANLVENYPGFPGGISGINLVRRLEEHLQCLGVKIHEREITRIEAQDGRFLLKSAKDSFSCRYLILATGTQPVSLESSLVDANLQGRLAYEIREIDRLENSRVAVIGGGDAAFDYALNLARKNQVVILNRGESPRCLKLLSKRISQSPEVSYLGNVTLLGIEAKSGGGMWVLYSYQGYVHKTDVDRVLVAIGRRPCLPYFDEELVTNMAELEQSGRIYQVGDLKNGPFRQAVIAAGDGLRAAMQVSMKIQEAGK